MSQQKARVRIIQTWGEQLPEGPRDDVQHEFVTDGKPPYGMGGDRDPDRCNFCVMPFEAPASRCDYHRSKTQLMVWYGYHVGRRKAEIITIPARGRIEIEAI